MRDLTPDYLTAAGSRFTAPVMLLEITLATQTLRFTTRRQPVDIDGTVFDRLVRDVRIEDVAGGGMTAAATLDNSDGFLTPVFFGDDDYRRARARIWEGFDAERVLVFDGWSGGAVLNDGWINIDLASGGNYSLTPVIGPPLFNHVTPAGTVLQVGGETVVLEA